MSIGEKGEAYSPSFIDYHSLLDNVRILPSETFHESIAEVNDLLRSMGIDYEMSNDEPKEPEGFRRLKVLTDISRLGFIRR